MQHHLGVDDEGEAGTARNNLRRTCKEDPFKLNYSVAARVIFFVINCTSLWLQLLRVAVLSFY